MLLVFQSDFLNLVCHSSTSVSLPVLEKRSYNAVKQHNIEKKVHVLISEKEEGKVCSIKLNSKIEGERVSSGNKLRH